MLLWLCNSDRKQWSRIMRAALIAVLCVVMLPSVWAAGQRSNVRAKRKPKPLPPVDTSTLLWPPPPQITRIAYQGQFFGERDLIGEKMKKPGWLERAAGVSIDNAERPRLKKPYGVAVDSRGLIYVADSAQHNVFVFDLEKKQLAFRGGERPAQLLVPIGVAIDDQDRLFVSDAEAHNITCFDAKGTVLEIFGSDKLDRPAGMAVDNDLRRLYVADVKGSRLAIFDLDTFKFTHYIKGQGPSKEEPHGYLGTPTNLAINPDGLIYVVDTILNRVEVFDTDGNYVRGFGEQGNTLGKFARPKGIAIDSDGHIYVADDEFNNIQIFTPEGQPLMVVGSFGGQPGQFLLLTGLAFDKHNRLIATDGGPLPRIEMFRYVTDSEAKAAEAKKSKPDGAGTGDSTTAKAKPETKQEPK